MESAFLVCGCSSECVPIRLRAGDNRQRSEMLGGTPPNPLGLWNE